MYRVCADINDVEYRAASLNDDFTVNEENLFNLVDENTKVLWMCSPNNPTGNALPHRRHAAHSPSVPRHNGDR